MKVGVRLKQKRQEMGLSMAKLRDVTGISATYIMQIEKGYLPTNQILVKLARALHLDFKDLLRRLEFERDPEAFELLHGTEGVVEVLGPEGPVARMIPVVDYTQAGHWREVVDAFSPGQGFDEVPITSIREDLIALKVRGRSMEPVIRDGQVVVVDPHRQAGNGDIVVAVNNGQSTIKRFFQADENTLILEPLNPAFEKIVISRKDSDQDLRIVGVVIEIKLVM